MDLLVYVLIAVVVAVLGFRVGQLLYDALHEEEEDDA